jgi:LmbE family N-acetylglucosaminyl deacetylase
VVATAAAAATLAATGMSAVAAEERHKPPANEAADLDVLFVGAHPDDEAWSLAAFGQWNEDADVDAGVITVTRGEGGGNAVGLEEGPELGLLREAEERRAVAFAGIENVFNLDKIDFYYTLSSPLTEEAWGDDTLERVVRVMRATRPEVIVTMNPSPVGGNHGNHQQAARLAVEAYYAAADPNAFPEQLDEEGLSTWSAARILQGGASGSGVTGSACETTPYDANDATDTVFGVWQGRTSQESGETWAMHERRATWEYVSQGWAGFPPPPTDPEEIGCDYFTLVDSRTPYPDPASGQLAALQGAVLPAEGGLPLGTEFYITPSTFQVLPGQSFDATVSVGADRSPLFRPDLTVDAPDGWDVEITGSLPRVIRPGKSVEVDVVVTPPSSASLGERVELAATLTTARGAGSNSSAVEVASTTRGQLAQRTEAQIFVDWAQDQKLPKLESLIDPLASVGTGRTEPVTVDVTNDGDTAASGTVQLDLADGFSAEPAIHTVDELAPGTTTSVTFDVTNTDTSLPTSNRAAGGGYPFQVVTELGDDAHVQDAVLELVPTTEIPMVDTAPEVDGVASSAEYPGAEIDTSTRWEGQEATPEDISSTTRFSFTDDALYVFVDVTDDELGTVLTPEDCKRHWRTDSVEITIDPRGSSDNTSTTFKTGIFPVTDDPDNGNPPCFERDADNNQGTGEETAPGMTVASRVSEQYDGYTIETKIPFSALPDTIDPSRMALNVLVYDSDTQDKTGQTRIGWSTFGGVQAAPFRWALATLPGLAESDPAPVPPTLPDTAVLSVDSPQSIDQAAADGVGLGGGPALSPRTARLTSVSADDSEVTMRLQSRVAGDANVFLVSGLDVVGSDTTAVKKGSNLITVPATSTDDVRVLVAFSTDDGTLALAADAT